MLLPMTMGIDEILIGYQAIAQIHLEAHAAGFTRGMRRAWR